MASSLGPNTLVAPAKISSAAEATSAIGAAVKKFGKVDVLVNSAGRMNQDSKIGEIDPDAWWEDFVRNQILDNLHILMMIPRRSTFEASTTSPTPS